MQNKLTEAQRRVLGGPIYEHFDVWAGYWWTDAEDGGARIAARTVDVLTGRGLIERGQTKRVFSGRHCRPYTITEAGRLALESINATR